MNRYHVNPRTGRPGICRARYSCPYGSQKEHFDNKEDARTYYEAKMKKKEIAEAKKRAPLKKNVMAIGVKETKREPIKIKPNKVPVPDYYDQYLLDATDVEPIDYYSNGYTQLTEVDGVKAVEIALGTKREDWPEDLVEVYEKNEQDWNNVSNWDVEFGYYEGEDPTVYPPSNFKDELNKWYWRQPNAADAAGVLEHVRGKGHDTTGQTPVEAVKNMLREENELVLPWIEDATSVATHRVKFSDLRVNQKHYGEAQADPEETFSTNDRKYLGIVHWSPKDGYKLLNGYNRFKASKDNNEQEANFIVLQKW